MSENNGVMAINAGVGWLSANENGVAS